VPWLQMTNMISYQGLVRTFHSSGISQNQYIEMGKRFYLARATFVLQFSIYQFSTPVRSVCITLTQ
ncbi:hypothetical protein ACU62_10280, partial [Escherichia coli]